MIEHQKEKRNGTRKRDSWSWEGKGRVGGRNLESDHIRIYLSWSLYESNGSCLIGTIRCPSIHCIVIVERGSRMSGKRRRNTGCSCCSCSIRILLLLQWNRIILMISLPFIIYFSSNNPNHSFHILAYSIPSKRL